MVIQPHLTPSVESASAVKLNTYKKPLFVAALSFVVFVSASAEGAVVLPSGSIEERIQSEYSKLERILITNYTAQAENAIQDPQLGAVKIVALMRHLRIRQVQTPEEDLRRVHRRVEDLCQSSAVKTADPWRLAKYEVEATALWNDLRSRLGLTNDIDIARHILADIDVSAQGDPRLNSQLILLRERANKVLPELLRIIDHNPTGRTSEIAFVVLPHADKATVENEILSRMPNYKLGSLESLRAMRVLGEVGGAESDSYLNRILNSQDTSASNAARIAISRLRASKSAQPDTLPLKIPDNPRRP